MAQKFYVVWSGRQTGVFTDWASAQRAVDKYAGARFKSFPSRAQAEQALRRGGAPSSAPKTAGRPKTSIPGSDRAATHGARQFDVSIYCDGACEPNPGHAGSGIVVYRAGELAELWFGLYNPMGTNNSAELNALYHALVMAEREITPGNTVELFERLGVLHQLHSQLGAEVGKERLEKTRAARSKTSRSSRTVTRSTGALKKILKLCHVAAHAGTEGNELADRMAMLGVRLKEKELRLYEEAMDIPALLKLQAG